MNDPRNLADRILALVAEECGVQLSETQLESRLEEDFGMTGDDGAEFLEAFAKEFGVDLSGLDFHKHFGPEGCNPFWLINTPDFLRDHGEYPITVDHLIRVAEAGRWYSPPKSARAKLAPRLKRFWR